MSLEPVVVSVNGGLDLRACACADVLSKVVDVVDQGLAWAEQAFSRLPGLALVALRLPDNRILLMSVDRQLGFVEDGDGVIERAYLGWATGDRAHSSFGGPALSTRLRSRSA
ncbi:hypothetical protein Q5530_32975 [Saccharothrix sp. BKS2]|uniref:hypothetical protein n=1 Tax=Saccharothrix sp. BKS2 TaxID=3064400 RepID=UPI0039E8F0A7